jgi:hypothetical protein
MADNPHTVHVAESGQGWEVRILGLDGGVVFTRSCQDETEARTFASTIQQHVYWLSAEKFREYYRLSEPV